MSFWNIATVIRKGGQNGDSAQTETMYKFIVEGFPRGKLGREAQINIFGNQHEASSFRRIKFFPHLP